jgi:adenylylsulfate kinase-like enzyme
MNNSGILVLVAAIAPNAEMRKLAKQIIGDQHYLEIYLSTPLEVCESRDPKGLYRKVRAGSLKGFTGIDSPYDPPSSADLEIATHEEPIAVSLEKLITLIDRPAG